MKKTFTFLIATLFLISCNENKINGVWMSYDGKANDRGFYLDLNKNIFGRMPLDSTVNIKLNINKEKLMILPDTIGIEFKIYDLDSIEIEPNTSYSTIFKPLNLNHKLDVSKKDLEDFLLNCKLPELEIFKMSNSEFLLLDFTKQLASLDSHKKMKIVLSNRMGQHTNKGDWFIVEVYDNFFLFFRADDMFERNVYQIISMDKNKMKLEPLFESTDVNGITELTTSL